MPLGCVSFSRKSQNLFIFFLLKKVQLGIGCCFYLKIMDRRFRCGDAGSPNGGDLW
jgi:hypothetical protein